MFNFELMSSVLKYCGCERGSAMFGMQDLGKTHMSYIDVNALLLDYVSLTDDIDLASVALVYILNMGTVDTSSVSDNTLQALIEELVNRALVTDVPELFIVLYMYTGSSDVLDIIKTYHQLDFDQSVALLLLADLLTGKKLEGYTLFAMACIETAIIQGRYNAEKMWMSMGILFKYQQYVEKSKICKQLLKLFIIIPSANNILTRCGLSLTELVYLTLQLRRFSTYSNKDSRNSRLLFKFLKTCACSVDVVPDYMHGLMEFSVCNLNIYMHNSTEPAECPNDANFKKLAKLCTDYTNCAELHFIVTLNPYDDACSNRVLHLIQFNPKELLHYLKDNIDRVTDESILLFFKRYGGIWECFTKCNIRQVISLLQMFIDRGVSTLEDFAYKLENSTLCDLADYHSDRLLLQPMIEKKADSFVIGKVLHTLLRNNNDVLNEQLSNVFMFRDFLYPYMLKQTSSVYTRSLQYMNHGILALVNQADIPADEKRHYVLSWVQLALAIQSPLTDDIYRMAYTEEEFEIYERRLTEAKRSTVSCDLESIQTLDDLSTYLEHTVIPDFCSDIINDSIWDLLSKATPIDEALQFISTNYTILIELKLDTVSILKFVIQRLEGVC